LTASEAFADYPWWLFVVVLIFWSFAFPPVMFTSHFDSFAGYLLARLLTPYMLAVPRPSPRRHLSALSFPRALSCRFCNCNTRIRKWRTSPRELVRPDLGA
jgi:hypothetical protein